MRGGAAWERLRVKADMVLFAGNTVWSISDRVRGVREDALYKSTLPLPLLFYSNVINYQYRNVLLRNQTNTTIASLRRSAVAQLAFARWQSCLHWCTERWVLKAGLQLKPVSWNACMHGWQWRRWNAITALFQLIVTQLNKSLPASPARLVVVR